MSDKAGRFAGAMVERGGGWVKVQRLSDEDADALVAIVQGCDGAALAEAWRAWLRSTEGRECTAPPVGMPFLENRLWYAFMAGAAQPILSQYSAPSLSNGIAHLRRAGYEQAAQELDGIMDRWQQRTGVEGSRCAVCHHHHPASVECPKWSHAQVRVSEEPKP